MHTCKKKCNYFEDKCMMLNFQFSTCFYRLMSQSHYDVLGVRKDASDKEIKVAYRDLCKKVY